MHIENEISLDFCDVLIKPKRSTLNSRSEVSLLRTFKFKHSDIKLECLAIMASNMDSTGTFEMFHALKKHKMLTVLHKHYSKEELISFYNDITEEESNYVFYSLGIRDEDLEKYNHVRDNVNKKINFVCIDVPSAYIEKFVDFLKAFRADNNNVVIMAGNVCSGEMTEELILAGADIIKAGIGGGSACSTRKVAGVGIPQLSCVIDCADHAHGLGGLVCSDGGITQPGDLGKAFGANSDFVMIGGVFAGHDESGGDWVVTKNIVIDTGYDIEAGTIVCYDELIQQLPHIFKDKKYRSYFGKRFYGMSSYEAQEKHYGEIKDYRASEGREYTVPYRGSIEETLKEYLGGLRSTLTYTGSKNLKELSKRTTFVRTNRILNTSLGN